MCSVCCCEAIIYLLVWSWLVFTERTPVMIGEQKQQQQFQPFGILIKKKYVQTVDRLPSISYRCDHFHDAHVSNFFQINNNKLLGKFVCQKKRRQMEYCGHFTVINSVCRHHFRLCFCRNWVIYYQLSLKWCRHKQMKAFLSFLS